jgi:acyl-CoA thioesterase I
VTVIRRALWYSMTAVLLVQLPLCANAAKPMTIMVLGDSISAAYGIQREAGWVALLEQRLRETHPQARVVNASISGETTDGGLTRLPEALAQHKPRIVILELGGNDGLRGYPVVKLRENLQKMIDLSLTANATPVLVGMQIPPNYGIRYTTAFRDTFSSLATTNRIPVVPFLLEGVALGPGLMQSDGIHPTAQAQPAMLDTVWAVLQPLLARH